MRTALAALGLAVLFAAGCESTHMSADSGYDRRDNAVADQGRMDRSDMTTAGISDRDFVNQAAQSGIYEIKSSQLALQKSEDESIKKLARAMIDDHTKANDELKSLASSKGITLPTSLDQEHQGKLDTLSKLSGKQFDQEYLSQQAAAHQKAVNLFQQASTSLSDKDLRTFADKTLPTLEHHLAMSKSDQHDHGTASEERTRDEDMGDEE